MSRSLVRTLPLSLIVTALLAQPTPAISVRCVKAAAKRLPALGEAARRCLAACQNDAAEGSLRRCDVDAPDDRFRRCLRRAERKTREGLRRTCGRLDLPLDEHVRTLLSSEPPAGFCGDGAVGESESCDDTAPSNGGCPDGLTCVACLHCGATCGDGRISGDEVCDPLASVSGCPPDEECVGCHACGRGVPSVTSEEDVAPCAAGVGDRWTFEVEVGTVVTIGVDTVDGSTAAKLRFEGTCPGAGNGRSFRAAVGVPCTYAPPNHPNPGFDCPRLSFVAAASGTCSLVVGVTPELDGGVTGCSDPTTARYRLSVSARAIALVGDDVPPGLLSD